MANNRSHKLIKYYLILGLLIVCFILVFQLFNIFNHPAEGVIYRNYVSARQTVSLNWSPVLVSNDLISFQYPKFMTADPTNRFFYPVVSQFSYSYQELARWQLAISVLNVPSGSLQDNNAYLVRSKNPQEYQLSTIKLNRQKIYVMNDIEFSGFNKIAFLIHGPYQAIVSMSSQDPNNLANLNKVFVSILSSFKWVR